MKKAEARKLFRSQRMALTDQQRAKDDDLLLIQFQTLQLPYINFLFSYWPIEENKEINTHLFTDYLAFLNPELKICYPKTHQHTHQMEAIVTDEGTHFQKNDLNIYEPEAGEVTDPQDIDLVIVPMLVCDQSGHRVGYGKGFYDRYLHHCRPDCIKVGLSYFEPLDRITDTHQFDVPLNLCITPQNVYVF